MSHKTLKPIFLVFGSLSLTIGIVGIFVPLLPTTPFLILAAYFYNKGSSRFHSWLIHHRYFGSPIVDWQKRRVIRKKYKMLATVMLVASLIVIVLKETIPVIGKITFAIFMSGLLIFIWRQKSKSTTLTD